MDLEEVVQYAKHKSCRRALINRKYTSQMMQEVCQGDQAQCDVCARAV